MSGIMIIGALILITCMLSTKVFYKFGVPVLLIFIILGMVVGSDGLVGIHFDDFDFTGKLCSLGLVFIMFYGGFGTNWKMAKPVVVPSALMSSLGVLITAILTGLFCSFVLKMPILEALLIGTVVASTDYASVSTVLRSQKLNLKGSIASLLELESGSNDPMAYMLTLLVLSLMKNPESMSLGNVLLSIMLQISIGIIIGAILAKITIIVLRRSNFEIEGFYTIFIVAIALLSYGLSDVLGGNGYLSVYITGIVIGNNKIPNKRVSYHFLDGSSWIMQIILFFLLGLLSLPSQLGNVSLVAVAISIFMIFIARPLTTFAILTPFKFSINEMLFISWVGLRGAASLVFTIFAITGGIDMSVDIFHIIFFIALFSVAIQGSLIPIVAKKLDLIDDSEEDNNVLKTFTDYVEDVNEALFEHTIAYNSSWVGITLVDMNIPSGMLVVMIKRHGKIVVPRGFTVLEENDTLVFTGNGIKEYIENNEKIIVK